MITFKRPSTYPLALALSRHGKLFIEESGESFPLLDEAVAGRIGDAFRDGNPSALLHLATVELETPLPASFAFWHNFTSTYLT